MAQAVPSGRFERAKLQFGIGQVGKVAPLQRMGHPRASHVVLVVAVVSSQELLLDVDERMRLVCQASKLTRGYRTHPRSPGPFW